MPMSDEEREAWNRKYEEQRDLAEQYKKQQISEDEFKKKDAEIDEWFRAFERQQKVKNREDLETN